MNNILKEISNLYNSLPGVSNKTANRLAIETIENPKINNYLNNIILLSEKLEKDFLTGLIIEKNRIANNNKDNEILLILETNSDMQNIYEKINSNNPIFILDIKNKKDFRNTKIVLERLFTVIKKISPKEILFLLTPSIESELIMRVIKEELEKSDIQNKPQLTRISMGIPFGGSIEYSDKRTIREAMKKREKA